MLSRPDKQANLVLTLPGLSYHDERRYVQRTLDVILGEGMTSRLFIEIRERRGLAYSVGSYFNQLADIGNGAIYAGVDPGKARETVAAIVGELRKLRDIPVPADELARSKELRKGRMLMGLEDSYAMASWLGSNEILYGYVPTPEEIAERIDAVTVADRAGARRRTLHAGAVQPGAGRPVRGRGGVAGVLAGSGGVEVVDAWTVEVERKWGVERIHVSTAPSLCYFYVDGYRPMARPKSTWSWRRSSRRWRP